MIIFLLDYPNLHAKSSRAYFNAKVQDVLKNILSVESKNTKMLFPIYMLGNCPSLYSCRETYTKNG